MPGNTRLHIARREKKRRRIRKVGDLTSARKKLWQAITTAEDVLLNSQDDDHTALKAVHALTQSTQAYARLVEAEELAARLDELESTVYGKDRLGI